MGHSLRPRKKNLKSSSRQKPSKSKPKKQPPSSSQSSKQKTGPSSPADIDELVRQSSQTGVRRQALELERCEEILKKLMKYRYSWPFREPVSTEEAEDYLDIISQPMDFHTMLGKFRQGSYRHGQDFLEDLKLVFSNAEEYNQQGSTVLSCMVKTEQTFTELLQKQLPSLGYLRRRSRKRISQAPATSEEDEEKDEEEEEEQPPPPPPKKKMQNGKSSRKKTREVRGRREPESESGEDEEDDDDEEDDGRRRSKRTSTTSGRKDYREQDSDGERDTRRTRQRGGRGHDAGRANSAEVQSSRQRHSKRQKRS